MGNSPSGAQTTQQEQIHSKYGKVMKSQLLAQSAIGQFRQPLHLTQNTVPLRRRAVLQRGHTRMSANNPHHHNQNPELTTRQKTNKIPNLTQSTEPIPIETQRIAHYKSYVDMISLRRDEMVKSQYPDNKILSSSLSNPSPIQTFQKQISQSPFLNTNESAKSDLVLQFEALQNIEQQISIIKKFHGSQKMKQYQNLTQKYIEMELATQKFDKMRERFDLLTQQQEEEKPQEMAPEGWGSTYEIHFKGDTAEIKRIAEESDFLQAASYLNFITAQFQIEVDIHQEAPSFDVCSDVHGMFQPPADLKTRDMLLGIIRRNLEVLDDPEMQIETKPVFNRETYLDLENELQSLDPTSSSFNSDLKSLKLKIGKLVMEATMNSKETMDKLTQQPRIREAIQVELKKRDLAKKFEIKNNLNQIFKDREDTRNHNWEMYFAKLSKIVDEEISNVNNFKNFVESKDKLSKKEKNTIFHLHNTASDDQHYGKSLMAYVLQKIEEEKLEDGDEQKLLLFSIDWPVDIQIEMI